MKDIKKWLLLLKGFWKEMNKFENLQELKEKINLNVKGLENYLQDGSPSIIFANHSCLMDVFYLGASIPEPHAMVVSTRLTYKRDGDRKTIIDKYLYTLPCEPPGGAGAKYFELSLGPAIEILKSGITLSIFPEGIFNDRNTLSRARTGAARILYGVRDIGIKPKFIPAAIKVQSNDPDLGRYTINPEDKIDVNFLEPVEYEEYYDYYKKHQDFKSKNFALHKVSDVGMQKIADCLGIPYSKDYRFCIPKNEVMYEDGSTLPIITALQDENIERARKEINTQTQQLIKSLRRNYKF